MQLSIFGKKTGIQNQREGISITSHEKWGREGRYMETRHL